MERVRAWGEKFPSVKKIDVVLKWYTRDAIQKTASSRRKLSSHDSEWLLVLIRAFGEAIDSRAGVSLEVFSVASFRLRKAAMPAQDSPSFALAAGLDWVRRTLGHEPSPETTNHLKVRSDSLLKPWQKRRRLCPLPALPTLWT
jgi:hypothetical protein